MLVWDLINVLAHLGVKPLIHQSELRIYTKKVVIFKKKVIFALLYFEKYKM